MLLFSKKIFYIMAFMPLWSFSQDKLELDILFGSYMNDHVNKTFHVQERHWVLKNNVLSYAIDVHETRYADTITLKADDIKNLKDYIDGINLSDSIFSDLSVDYLSKTEWSLIVEGRILWGDKKSVFKIKANSPGILDENKTANEIKGVEDLLYEILDKYNE